MAVAGTGAVGLRALSEVPVARPSNSAANRSEMAENTGILQSRGIIFTASPLALERQAQLQSWAFPLTEGTSLPKILKGRAATPQGAPLSLFPFR